VETDLPNRERVLIQAIDYSQQLRPIGQRLETLGVKLFTLRVEEEAFVVRGQRPRQPPADEKPARGIWQLFRSRAQQPGSAARLPYETIELRLTLDDIEKIDQQAQSSRSGSRGSSEAHSLSQILRAVGALVDQKRGRLLGVKKDQQCIVIEYESVSKQIVIEEFTVSDLYDFWVKMYLKRQGRS
jgi:hypothetical protein